MKKKNTNFERVVYFDNKKKKRKEKYRKTRRNSFPYASVYKCNGTACIWTGPFARLRLRPSSLLPPAHGRGPPSIWPLHSPIRSWRSSPATGPSHHWSPGSGSASIIGHRCRRPPSRVPADVQCLATCAACSVIAYSRHVSGYYVSATPYPYR